MLFQNPQSIFKNICTKYRKKRKQKLLLLKLWKKEIEKELALTLVAEFQETITDQFETNDPVIQEVVNEKKVEMKGKWMKVAKSSSQSRNTSAGISGRGKI